MPNNKLLDSMQDDQDNCFILVSRMVNDYKFCYQEGDHHIFLNAILKN